MIIRKILDEDKLETMKLSSLCFEYPFSIGEKTEEEYLEHLRKNPSEKLESNWDDQLMACDDDGSVMACLATPPLTYYFEGKPYEGNGVGNVCTYPQYRNRGAIREMFAKLLVDAYDHNHTFSYLFPFSEGFYQKFGYHRLSNSILYELQVTGIPNMPYLGTFHLLTQDNDLLLEQLKTAYDHFAQQYNMMVQRKSFDWAIVKEAKAYLNNNYAYVYKDEHGVPKGYFVFKKDGNLIRCRELVFYDFKTLKAIFSFVKSFSADMETFRFHAPATIHMESFCTDFSRFHGTMKITSNGMVRVINVATVLQNAIYRGTDTINLCITDPFIPENNGLFITSFKDGKATSVEFIKKEQISTEQVDVSMDISLFSAAIVGNYNVNDFEYLNDYTMNTSLEKLGKIFYKKKCFINNFF